MFIWKQMVSLLFITFSQNFSLQFLEVLWPIAQVHYHLSSLGSLNLSWLPDSAFSIHLSSLIHIIFCLFTPPNSCGIFMSGSRTLLFTGVQMWLVILLNLINGLVPFWVLVEKFTKNGGKMKSGQWAWRGT